MPSGAVATMRGLALALIAGLGSAEESYSCPSLPPASVNPSSRAYATKPSIDGRFKFIGGRLEAYPGAMDEVTSPIFDESTGARAVIGSIPSMSSDDALEAVHAAAAAWDKGQGAWPQMKLADRITAVEAAVAQLSSIRSQIVEALVWEIAKTSGDAAKEFDRTMDFISQAVAELKRDASIAQGHGMGDWTEVRRGPVGVMLGLAPFNYPLNEMYAMLMPALLMGNTAVLKLPAIGGLVHLLTAKAFAATLPPGVINFVSGSGRVTMAPIMKSGLVDVLGFIGGTRGADALIAAHPAPHRLKVFAQLEGKNLGIVLPDADLDEAVAQCVLGSLSYNGQRCTAIKLIMVHEKVADTFVSKLVEAVAQLGVGLPWEEGVSITPLPEPSKPAFLEALLSDALARGARLANADTGGGSVAGALFTPAVVDGVTPAMRLFHEEQFGPVVPVCRFSDISEVISAARDSWNGQQAAIFTSSAAAAAPIVDSLSSVVGRININAQCGRSPDTVPFSGRRSSAMGTMSVTEALRAFSVETVIAYPANKKTAEQVARGLDAQTNFLAPVA